MYISNKMHGSISNLVFSEQKRHLEAVYKENEEFLLFYDNLKGQAHELFLQEIRSLNGVVWFEFPMLPISGNQ